MTTQSEDEVSIRALLERWAKAVREENVEGILADHSEDILMFDLPGPTQTLGLTAYRNSWPQLFTWFDGSGVFDVSDIRVTAGGSVAFATARIRCQGFETNGKAVTLDVRLTVGLQKSDDRWTVTHEHHSIPSD